MLTALKEAEENGDENGHAHGGGAVQPSLGDPSNEGGHYNEQDLHERAEHLYSEYRDGLMSVHQQQEKRKQEIHEYYQKREQQWQRWQTVANSLPMSGYPMSVQLEGLPRAPPAQSPPRARHFQLTLQTDHEEATDLIGADPWSSTNVRI